MKGTLWCLHGAVGQAADWQGFAVPGWSVKRVDLWRFLACCPMSLPEFGRALNAEAAAGSGREMVDGRWQMADELARGAARSMVEPSAGEGLSSTIHDLPSAISRNVLVGYSMGGRLALQALLAGGPWDAAVLVAPHPGLESEKEREARRGSDAAWGSKALSGEWAEFLEAWNAQPVLAASSARSLLSVHYRREVARSFIDWSLGAQEPLWDELGEIDCPVLWCTGEQDAKFTALGERAVPLMNEGELWVAPGAGHRVPWDAPEAFGQRVGEFLERVLS
ncbi:alpha/beta fold hydrolase [Luteolibacter arcticus]|uniref:Alpha/beta fold hydrolase n=1 Tax=Luteolibacter arcticus TaxID=1581411 RepID=A0ABT3GQ28_9BACT|nr:alpha/beta fold hydrolase [Luteolibacter arcticus]MCW1925597.1 alpha/beta fold hydrolase [Luteolibacter arcticus]